MKSTILTIAVALVAGFALADDAKKGDKPAGKKGKGKGDPAALMERLDANKDGKISKEEFAASPIAKKISEKRGPEAVDKIFGAKDANGDGSLSKEEFAKRPAGKGKGKPDGKKPEKKKPDNT